MTEIKPCPHCGGEAQRFTLTEDDGPDNAGGDVITCTRCGACSHVEFGRKENLVSSWNNRTPDPSLIAGLREAREALGVGAKVPVADPLILVELRALCERAGYGNVMASASALWRDRLGELAGGEFVSGPCRSTAQAVITNLDNLLSEGGQ